MAESIQNLRVRSLGVRNETIAGANDAQRIGQLFYDIIVKMWGNAFDEEEQLPDFPTIIDNIRNINDDILILKNGVQKNSLSINNMQAQIDYILLQLPSINP